MARSYLINVDLNKNELQNARIQNLAAAPSAPVIGQIYFDTTLDKLRAYTAAGWINADGTDLPNGSVTSAKIADLTIVDGDISASAAIALSKLATDPLARANHTGTQPSGTITTAATDRLLGRDTNGAGTVEELTVGGGLEFTGAGGIQRGALTGEVTAAAGDGATTIAANAVTFAKMADLATDRLIGRDTAATGDPEAITVGGGIEFTGTGGIQTSAFTGDVTKAAGGTALTIGALKVVTGMLADDAVSNAKLANMATGTIKGRATAGTGDAEDLTAAQVKTLLAITATDVTGFDTQVRTNRLDQMAAPTAAVSMNGQKVTNVAAPTADTDAANKAYVDATISGMDWKGSVRAATTGPITLSGTQTIDGVAVIAGDRVLVKDQAAGAANGIYTVAAGAWGRAADADASAEVSPGMVVPVEEGTVNGDKAFILTTNGAITLGTTALTFTQLPGASTAYVAGAGLSMTGSTFDVGAGTGITVGADAIAIDTAVVARKFTAVLSTSATSYTVTHGLGNQWVTVQVYENSGSFRQVEVDVELTDANNATVRFATAPTANAYRVVITG